MLPLRGSVLCALGVVVVVAALVVPAASGSATGGVGMRADQAHNDVPLHSLRNFGFTFSLQVSAGAQGFVFHSQGVYVKPSSQDCRVDATIGPLQIMSRAVLIGSRVWLDDGNGLRRVRRSKVDFLDLCASDPSFWSGLDLGPPLAGFTGQPDTVNGIATRRFDVGGAASALGVSGSTLGLPAGFQVQSLVVWLADHGGWIAALNLGFSGTALACNDFARQQAGGAFSLTGPCSVTASVQLKDANRAGASVRTPR